MTDPKEIVPVEKSEMPEEEEQFIELLMEHRDLYPQYSDEDGLAVFMLKQLNAMKAAPTRQDVSVGTKPHPFDFPATTLLKNYNSHHSTCIETKKECTVGLGFWPKNWEEIMSEENPIKRRIQLETTQTEAEKQLDPLCDKSFLDSLGDAAEDYWQTGNGYLEIVRPFNKTNPYREAITGIHHISASSVHVVVEDDKLNISYEVGSDLSDSGGMSTGVGDNRFAKFGDLKDFISRHNITKENGQTISELIHFRRPTSLSKWYGMPDWLSAVVAIELVQCMHQHHYDFFLNRGVPEFMLFFLGKKIEKKNWDKIQAAMKANIGLGKSHKSLAVNLTDENMKVQLEKLAMEDGKGGDGFKDKQEILALNIVSAHRTPPLLAQIQIPGKLGATNEFPNALMGYQKLVIAPGQKVFRTELVNSLGNEEYNGSLSLTSEDFLLRTILDDTDMKALDTISRMRETQAEAQESGRDPKDGLKD